MKLSTHEIAWCAREAGFDGTDAPTGQPNLVMAVAIALAESAGDTDVMGRSTTGENLGQRDHGLWQISGRWHPTKLQQTPNWRDPLTNARLAKMIFDEAIRAKKPSGWSPWSTYNAVAPAVPAYVKWLPDAKFGAAAPFPIRTTEADHRNTIDTLLDRLETMLDERPDYEQLDDLIRTRLRELELQRTTVTTETLRPAGTGQAVPIIR